MEHGQVDAAVQCYEKALTVNPEYPEAHNNLGVILKESVNWMLQLSVNKALAIKPDFSEALNNLGNAFNELGLLDAAVKCYKKTLTL